MVRTVWVGVAFVCGAVLGVLATRGFTDRPAVTAEPVGRDTRVAAVATPVNPSVAPAPMGGATAHLPAEPLKSPRAPGEPSDAALAQSAPVVQTPDNSSIEDAVVRRIDVGTAFHQQIDRPSVPGFPNEFGDAHRTLEREARDNSWSDLLEAEIRNSLTADVSSGNIKVEFLECRSTVCELRLSSSMQSDAINTWSANSGAFPWSNRLQSIGMSMSMTDGRTQGLWLFRKPPK